MPSQSTLKLLLALLLCLTPLTASGALESEEEVDISDLPALEPTELMAQETKLVIEMLETIHFKNEEISDNTFERLITEYMENLDFNKLYFKEAHEAEFKRKYSGMLGHELRYNGELTAAFEMYEVYREIALHRIQWALEKIRGEWSFDQDESYQFDRSEAEWPKTEEEADELWTKRIKYELLQELLNDKSIEEARENIGKRYNRMLRRIKEFAASDVQEVFLTSLTQMFDPHSTFFSSETFEDFTIGMKLSLVGIGALLSEEDGYCVIKELIAGGPAKRSNELHPNDRIVAVAQEGEEAEDIVGMSLRKVVDRIRGEKGTNVYLTIIPADAPDDSVRKTVVIERDNVRINSSRCTAQLIEVPTGDGNKTPIGVIDIPSFYGSEEIGSDGRTVVTSVTADVEEHIRKLRDLGAQGIVLDLRRNGGGLLDEATDMTGLFIPRGPVVQVKDPYGKVWPVSDRDPKVVYSGPLMVLTSRYSASASEIVAGALQNYGRAIVIGNESTHGKGTVQQVLPLEDYVISRLVSQEKAGAAKLTVRKFYLPNGFSTQRKGVVPDITLPSVEQIMAVGESELPNALAWDYINPARRFMEMTLKDSFVEYLQAQSAQRQSELEEFQFLQQRIDWYKEREERTSVSLNLETRKRLMEEDKSFIESMKDKQRELAALNFPSTEVKLDAVLAEMEENGEESDDQASKSSTATDEMMALTDIDPDSAKENGEEEEEPVPDFDIHLRESLRILVNAIEQSDNPSDWKQPALPIASKTRFEELVN